MEELIYSNIGAVLQLDKSGELIQKRMKAAKVCDGLFITEPDKSGCTQFICELNGVAWLECKESMQRVAEGAKLIPGYFEKIKAGIFDGESVLPFRRELSRRINRPDAPAIMELKQPERKKPAPLAENEKRVNVFMYKTIIGEDTTEKKLTIKEIAPHIYTHVYKLRRYGERVKIIFEVDGVYFQGADKGAFIMEREDFTEVCTNAYKNVRENIADGVTKGMAYFVELAKRIELAATSTETPQISTKTVETVNVSAEAENSEERANLAQSLNYEQQTKAEQSPQPPKFASQSCKMVRMANYTIPTRKRAERTGKQPKVAFRKFRTTRRVNLRASTIRCHSNSPPYWSTTPNSYC